MSLTSKNPLRVGGATIYSGGVATGEIPITQGGQVALTIWSGGLAPSLIGAPGAVHTSGNQVRLWSGAGRLNTIIPHVQMTSGLQSWFYDAALVARSGAGPVASLIAESGARLIGILPPTFGGGVWSGTAVSPMQSTINFGTPFFSGLNVACPSGSPGFTVTITPEVNVPFN